MQTIGTCPIDVKDPYAHKNTHRLRLRAEVSLTNFIQHSLLIALE